MAGLPARRRGAAGPRALAPRPQLAAAALGRHGPGRLYLVSFDTGSRRGYVYLPLGFKIESVADVNRVREERRWQGLDFAIILAFTYLPGGWGQR